GHRARASRRTLRGLGRQSPNPCWVQPPMGLTPAARSPLQSVRAIRPPPAATTPLLNSTKAVDGILFSLDYGTFIRVRPVLRTYPHGAALRGNASEPRPGVCQPS